MGLLSGNKGLRRYIGPKRVVLLTVFACMTAGAWYLWKQGLLTPELLFTYIDAHPILAPVVFVALYSFCVFFVVPSLPFNLAAGFLWGPIYGSVLALAGSGLGSICAFLFARTALGRPLARKFDNRILDWLHNALEERGWKVVAFTRLNPIFPTGPLNFVFGLTAISTATYVWATLLFLYPPSLAFAWLGNLAQSMVLEGGYETAFKGAIAISAAVTLLYGGRLVAKILFGKQPGSEE